MRQRSYSRPAPTRVSSQAVATLLQETVKAGGNAEALLKSAGLTTTLDALKRQHTTVARSNLALLVRECIQILEARACEGSGHSPMVSGEFELLCHCLITSKTLAETISRSAQFCRMLEGKAGQLALVREGSNVQFTMATVRGRNDSSTLPIS